MARIGVGAQSSVALRELTQRLKQAGRADLASKMRRNIRKAGQPVVADIRAAAMAVRVTSSRGGQGRPQGSTNLRARVAAATTISQTRKGIRFKVDAKRVDPSGYGVTLPRYLDASLPRFRRWRHPVWWPGPIGTAPPTRVVEQRGSDFFFVTINRHKEQFRQAVIDAADETVKEMLG